MVAGDESGTEQLIMTDGLSSKPPRGRRAIGTARQRIRRLCRKQSRWRLLDSTFRGDLAADLLQIQRLAITDTVYNCRPKKGKKRIRQFGKVEIPQTAFIAAVELGDR
jgi:hypothetical protein